MLDHNSKQPTAASTSTTKTPPVDIKILKQKVREHFAEFATLMRRSVSAAWFSGEALNAVKKEIERGEFRIFLETEGISIGVAHRVMALNRGIPLVQIATFTSVDSALKSIPAKVPSRPAVDPDEPSKEEIKEIEQETDRYRAERAEADLDSSHQEVARLTALLPDAPPAPPPDDKLKRSEAKEAETWVLLQSERKANMRLKRKLSAIKNAIADGKPGDEILARFYGCVVKGAETQAVLGVHGQGVKV